MGIFKQIKLFLVISIIFFLVFPLQKAEADSGLFYTNDIYEFSFYLNGDWIEEGRESIKQLSPDDEERLITLFSSSDLGGLLLLKIFDDSSDEFLEFTKIVNKNDGKDVSDNDLNLIATIFGMKVSDYFVGENHLELELREIGVDKEVIRNVFWFSLGNELLELDYFQDKFENDRKHKEIFASFRSGSGYSDFEALAQDSQEKESFLFKIKSKLNLTNLNKINFSDLVDKLFERSDRYAWVPIAFTIVASLITFAIFFDS